MPAPSGGITHLERPAVRVFTLGRFDVEVNDAPLRFGRKAQRRPLDLLKLLVAYGGEGVCAEQIAEDLWPDSEGDVALAALRTTLSRLRKLIGAEAVLGNGGSLTLNPQVCWIDALALNQLLTDSSDRRQEQSVEQAQSALVEALMLYRGRFLPGDCSLPPLLSARTRLHRIVLRHLAELGQFWESTGQTAMAMELYRRGLEIDDAAENFAQKLNRRALELAAETQSVFREPRAARAVSGMGSQELTIEILPFEDLSLLGNHRRLADAIRETVISLLGALPHLTLVTRPTWGPPHWESAVRYQLQGSVMVSGNHVRVTAHLIDPRTGQHAWSEQVDHRLHDVIESRDQIAVGLADGLAGKLVLGDVAKFLLSPKVHVWKAAAQARVLLDHHTRQDSQRARALIGRILGMERKEPLIQGLQAITHVIESWKCWTANPTASLRAAE